MNKITTHIRDTILKAPPATLFASADFKEFLNDKAVNKALTRLEQEGVLVRIATGLYINPVETKYGILKPTLHEIAQKIAERDGAKIIPTGPTALNVIGLTTQVPMNAVYKTSGSARPIKIGNRIITFKRGVQKNFLFKGKLIPLIVIALKEIGKDNVTDEIKAHIKALIISTLKEDKEIVKHDLSYAPDWITQLLLPMLKEADYDFMEIER